MTAKTNHNYCLNCESPYPVQRQDDDEIYCLQCGQSSRDSRLSMVQLLKDGLSNIFNLDSRLVHTFRDILLPSKLTRTYIEGKRKYYVNPARLFVFLLIALISLLLMTVNLENTAFGVDKFFADAEKSKMQDSYRKLVDTLNQNESVGILDTIEKRLFKDVTKIGEDTIGQNLQMFGWTREVKDYGISSYDAVHLTSEDLFEKYDITGFWEKINVGQYIRVMTDPAGSIAYLIKNVTWAAILTILVMSFFLKLLYIRKAYYLVEHSVLLLNSHSLLFVIAILNLAFLQFNQYITQSSGIASALISISAISVFVLQFLTLKRYYRQGIIKTLIKQGLINFVYITIFLFSILLTAVISVFLY